MPRPDTKQAEKSQQTRNRLMDAALAVIAEEGWAGATTARISEVAAVSRGAQTHHFPTKSSLLLAALERTTWLYDAAIRDRISSLPKAERTMTALLSIFWEGFHDDPFNQSALEALVAARTEPELRDAVADLDQRAVEAMRSLAHEVVDPTAPVRVLEQIIEMSHHFFRGLVVQRGLHAGDTDHHNHLFTTW